MAALPQHKKFCEEDVFQGVSFGKSDSGITFAPLNYFWNQIPSTQMASSPIFHSALSEAY